MYERSHWAVDNDQIEGPAFAASRASCSSRPATAPAPRTTCPYALLSTSASPTILIFSICSCLNWAIKDLANKINGSEMAPSFTNSPLVIDFLRDLQIQRPKELFGNQDLKLDYYLSDLPNLPYLQSIPIERQEHRMCINFNYSPTGSIFGQTTWQPAPHSCCKQTIK